MSYEITSLAEKETNWEEATDNSSELFFALWELNLPYNCESKGSKIFLNQQPDGCLTENNSTFIAFIFFSPFTFCGKFLLLG